MRHFSELEFPVPTRPLIRQVHSMIRTLLTSLLFLLGCLHAAESRIWVDATINGQNVRLAFDTGATDSTLFRDVAERLKIKISGRSKQSKTGSLTAPMSEPVDFAYRHVKFKTEFLI